jgi:hypothetical protein
MPSFLTLSLLVTALLPNALPKPQNWQPFTSPDRSFTVLLPSKPVKQSQSNSFPPYKDVPTVMYIAEAQDKKVAYGIAYTEFPLAIESTSQVQRTAMFNGARDATVKRFSGKLLHDKRVTFLGHPGLDFEISVGGGMVYKSTIFLVKKRLYQIVSVIPGTESASPTTQRFVASFKLNGK